MRKARLTALVLSGVMLMTALCGCQGGGDSSTPSKGESGTNSTEESSEVKEVRNFNGEEFVIGSHFIEGMFPEPGKSEFGDQLLARWEELEQEYNCKFVTKTAPADIWLTDVMTNMAAGEKYADIIETNLWWFSDIVRADYLEDLGQVNDLHLDDDIWFPTMSKAAEYKGKTYGVNWLTWYNKLPMTTFYVVYFNKRLIADANQPDPYELFEKGEWTWENFRNIAKATDNDKDDIDGIVALDRCLEISAIRSNGVREILQGDDGKYSFGWADERAYAALEWVRDIIQIDKTFGDYYDGRTAGVDWHVPIQRFADGKATFMVYHSTAVAYEQLPDMEDDFGFIPFPKGPSGTSDYNAAITGDTNVYCIPITATDKERSGFMMRQMAQPMAGTDAESWKAQVRRQYFRDDTGFDHYVKSLEQADSDYFYMLSTQVLDSAVRNLLSVTRDRAATPAEAIGTMKSMVDTLIETNLNS